jgi:hypothetical protein
MTDTLTATDLRPVMSRQVTTPLLAAAGVALVIAQGLLPPVPSSAAGAVRAISSHRSAEVISALAFLVAAACLIWGLLSIAARPFDRGRGLTRIGLLVSSVGAFWLIGGRACFNLTEVAITSTQTPAAAVAAAKGITGSSALALLLPTLVSFLVGPVLFGLGLWRAGVAPWWPAAAWLAGVAIVDATDTSVHVVPALGMVVLTVALTAWGRAFRDTSGT